MSQHLENGGSYGPGYYCTLIKNRIWTLNWYQFCLPWM